MKILNQQINNVAIIPARGGSKSIPMKNLMDLNGRKLIEYSIEIASYSKNIDKVIVTSENSEILDLSKSFKDIICIKRPLELASDNSKTEHSLLHAISELENNFSVFPKYIFTLEPTSPLRSLETIDKAIKTFLESDYDSLISLVETRDCIGKIINNDFHHLDKNLPRRRQEREMLYKECGTIYGTKVSILKSHKTIFGDKILPFIVPKVEALDINDPEDFELIESIMKGRKN